MKEITPYLLSVVGALVMVLIGLVSWIGSRLWQKMDVVENRIEEHNTNMVQRVMRVETKVDSVEHRIEHIERHVFTKTRTA